MRTYWACALVLLVAGCTCREQVGDCVYLRGRPADIEAGLVLNAKKADGTLVDKKVVRTSQNERNVGKLVAGPSNDLACFCAGRLPAFLRKPVGVPGDRDVWSADKDIARVYLREADPLPLFVWLVREDALDDAKRLVEYTNKLFAQERMGIEFDATFADVSGKPNADDFLAWNTKKHHSDVEDDSDGIQLDDGEIAFTPGRLNVYFVKEVDGVKRAGHHLGDTIAVGVDAASHLLAHEIGHACFLNHPDEMSDEVKARFNECNVMWSDSFVRNAIAEGQILKAHVAASSALNKLYDLRDGTAEQPVLIWYQYVDEPFSSVFPIWFRVWPEPLCPMKIKPRLVESSLPQLPGAALFAAWAERDCRVGPQPGRIRAEILRRGPSMEGDVRALLAGPGRAKLALVGKGAREAHRTLGLPGSPQAFANGERRRFIDNWQAAAIDVLGDIGTRRSLPALEPVAAGGISLDNRERAARAIDKINRRHPR